MKRIEHSSEPGFASGTTWSGKRCCNDMMIPLQENPDAGHQTPAIFCDLSFVRLIHMNRIAHSSELGFASSEVTLP
jgi:hypothetical protein